MRNVGTYLDPIWEPFGEPVFEAGRRAGMDRERRALEAFIGAASQAVGAWRKFAVAKPARPSRSPTCRYRKWGVPPRSRP